MRHHLTFLSDGQESKPKDKIAAEIRSTPETGLVLAASVLVAPILIISSFVFFTVIDVFVDRSGWSGSIGGIGRLEGEDGVPGMI